MIMTMIVMKSNHENDDDHDDDRDDLVKVNPNDDHDDLDHLVDVKVETLLHPALRLLELLLQVHHLLTINWHENVHYAITALWMVIQCAQFFRRAHI